MASDAERTKRAEALAQLTAKWEQQDLPLKAVATQAVPGAGDPTADIMVIGEAPGKNEDLQGEPFVGAAGKFLNELLGTIGLEREQVFIANVIKHRPPNNRDPLPEEIEAYRPWLEEQVKIIAPKLFVTLGRFSMDFLLGPGHSISKIHGQPKRKDGKVIMPMYHPAAALYRGDLRDVLKADFQKIPKVLELIEKGDEEHTQEENLTIEAQQALL